MCGHVGVFGKDIRQQDLEIFKELLWLDQLRGRHGTGVGVMAGNYGISYMKKAVPADEYLNDKDFSDYCKDTCNITARAIMGHNRYATVGSTSDSKNAHPFLHGNVMCAHNGTLDTRTALSGSVSDFVVDSNQLAYTLSQKPLAEFITKVDGAFALVWMDNRGSGAGSINFIRNHERPMWIAKVKDKDIWFYASEREMIELSANRKRRSNVLEFEELPVGEHWCYTLEKGGTVRTVEKYDIPRYKSYWTGAAYSGGYSGKRKAGRSSASSTLAHTPYEKFAKNYSINKGDVVEFIPEVFRPYGTGHVVPGSAGYIIGYAADAPAIPAVLQGVTPQEFIEMFSSSNKLEDYIGKAFIEADIYTSTNCKILHFGSHLKDIDNQPLSYQDDANIVVPHLNLEVLKNAKPQLGSWFIRSWKQTAEDLSSQEFIGKYATCACCDKRWTDKMLENVGWFDADQPICSECVDDMEAQDIYTAANKSIKVAQGE